MSLATSFNIQIYWETFEVPFEAEKHTKVAFFTLMFSSSTRFYPWTARELVQRNQGKRRWSSQRLLLVRARRAERCRSSVLWYANGRYILKNIWKCRVILTKAAWYRAKRTPSERIKFRFKIIACNISVQFISWPGCSSCWFTFFAIIGKTDLN